MPRVGGVVLCGGRSLRMGRPKAWLPFGDELMLPRVVRIVGEVAAPLVIVAAPGQDLPPLPADVRVVRDPVEDRGPLQGLAAGLAALAGHADAVYLSSCDVPLLKPAFVQRLVELLGVFDICVPQADGYEHPLAAVYRTTVRPHVEALLAAGRLRPVFLFEAANTRFVTADEWADVDASSALLRNLNTPDEYAAALTAAGLPLSSPA